MNQVLTSTSSDHMKSVYDTKRYKTKTHYERSLIDQHLFQISFKQLKAENDLPLIGDTRIAFTSDFSLGGHFFTSIKYN